MGIITDWEEYPDPYDDDYEQVEEWELDDPNEWGCHFPEQCLMAYTDHMKSECHTVQDVERDRREMQREGA
jgi:hypothetical protein